MRPKGKPTLADVDGTEPGKVMLVAVRLVPTREQEPVPMYRYFEEGPDDMNPWATAEGVLESIEEAWPKEIHWAIVGNWRARYLAWNWGQRGFIPKDALSPEAYLKHYTEGP